MYPEKLNKNVPYCYTAYEGNYIQCFTMHNYSIGMHMQDFFEINIVTKGEGMHYIERNKLNAFSGCVFVIPPKIPHGYSGRKGFDVCHILINYKFIEKYARDLKLLPAFFKLFNIEPLLRSTASETLHLTLDNNQQKKVKALTDALEEALKASNPVGIVTSNSLAMILIAYLCELFDKNSASVPDNSPDNAFINTLTLIHEHYNEKLTIDYLAHTAQLSRSAFIRKFNEICKTSPAKYITGVRIDAARHMLLYSTLSIEEIASECGFYDAAHFTKTFVAEIGQTPNSYRKSPS